MQDVAQTAETSWRQALHATFENQRWAFAGEPMRDVRERREDLRRLKKALVGAREDLARAIAADFGHRSHDETRLAEVIPLVSGINHSIRHLRGWVRPRRAGVHPLFLPARASVMYQPLGVVGIIAPWNYPLQLSLGPLVAALAAGNRAMIKLSEYTPHTNDALQGLLGNIFTEDRVSVVQGEAEVAAAFAALPFDHLLFTGSTPVGRKVMAAAAANLTPVTLELGGKSPAIVDASANLETAAERICFGKSMNAGQTCIAPDYVLCPVEDVGEFVAAYRRAFARMYPSLRDNPDYSTIVNDAHLERLEALIADARDRGARIEVLNPACETLADTRKLAPRLLLDTSEEMRVRNEEIFGPLLPVIAYERLGDAVAHVNRGPRPLALYWFGVDDARRRRVLESTHAGGVTVNDTLTHFVQESLPFGGIGESGMGQYHGHAGFLTFSKAKGVLRRGRFNPGRFAYPPYRPWVRRILEVLTLR